MRQPRTDGKTPLKQAVGKAESLKNRFVFEIVSGVFRGGERFPGVRELAEKYGLSRNTVRQAVDELVAQGILVRRNRARPVVAEHALDLLAAGTRKTSLRINFIFPPDQVGNALLMTLLQTCLANLHPEIEAVFSLHLLNLGDVDTQWDGDILVIFQRPDRTLLEKIHRRNPRIVILNDRDDTHNYLTIDHAAGGAMMADYLLRCGHADIGLLKFGVYTTSPDFESRFEGAQRRLDAVGARSRVAEITTNEFYKLEPHCFQALDDLRRRLPGMTACLCVCDMMAVGALHACRQIGLAVPEQISLVGFDDHFYTRHTQPALTTMKYPSEAMGIRLAEYLNAHLHGTPPPLRETITPLLVKRQSVKTLYNGDEADADDESPDA